LKIELNVVVFKDIPVDLQIDQVMKQMHLHGDPRRFEEAIHDLVEQVRPIARPKAMYKIGCVENKDPDSLEIDGVRFAGRLLRDNLDKVETVFICLATCGTEVEAIKIPPGDVMKAYCLDQIKLTLVISASKYLQDHLARKFGLGELSGLHPGELKQFPIEMQRKLFDILGDVEGKIGVKLTQNCALVPTKSRSGIFFSRETQFISCRMCLMKRCQARRAAYDPQLAAKYEM
jgi:hypothetical protein